jgi:enolase
LNELRISAIRAREVLDCRGLPTVQVDVVADDKFYGGADVPAGRSRGRHEPVELRDSGSQHGGLGVQRAISAVREHLGPVLMGFPAAPQRALDARLVELDGTPDGTPDRSRVGANDLLGISLATARALAAATGQPLYRHLKTDAHVLPVPQVNLNRGKRASNDLAIQEFAIIRVGVTTFSIALVVASETNLALRDILLERYGKSAVNVGDERRFVPPITEPAESLEQLQLAAEQAGHAELVIYAMDCAASHFYDALGDDEQATVDKRDNEFLYRTRQELRYRVLRRSAQRRPPRRLRGADETARCSDHWGWPARDEPGSRRARTGVSGQGIRCS